MKRLWKKSRQNRRVEILVLQSVFAVLAGKGEKNPDCQKVIRGIEKRLLITSLWTHVTDENCQFIQSYGLC